ncbi:MAG: succinate--CoA ligase subunit alpha [Thermoplasmata archaeon]|nr:succinate--CoA ligase subunit alpha [Thermoplasmata archaeon]
MAIMVDKDSKVMIQGITGGAGKFHTKNMIDYGTNIVGGVTPGKGGQDVEGVPVFDTVQKCVKEVNPDVSAVMVPARFAADAVLECLDNGLKYIILIAERIPIHDMLEVRQKAKSLGATVVGGNSPGVISPGKANVGIMPPIAFTEGRIGTVARSGAITYYLADTLTHSGHGETTCVGLGGDPILGSNFEDILKLFDNDPETEAMVMAGEIGGLYEEMCAEHIPEIKKPVIAFISGLHAPAGKRMGHAGAIVEKGMGTAESKVKALSEAGVPIAKKFSEIPTLIDEALGK